MSGNIGVFLAQQPAEVLPSTPVTARQLFVASFDALMRARGTTAVALKKATGISDATLSKFTTSKEHLQRWPTDKHFDALSQFFGVEPYVLLRPSEALGQSTDRGRIPDTKPERRRSVVDNPGDIVVTSSSPVSAEGGSALLHHPNRELLAALLAYWDELSPEARLELVGHGLRLRSSSTSAASTVGFKRA